MKEKVACDDSFNCSNRKIKLQERIALDGRSLVPASLHLYNAVLKWFVPTHDKQHYMFGIADLKKIFEVITHIVSGSDNTFA